MPRRLAGRIDARFDTLLESRAPVQYGGLSALAVTTATRAPALPEVPTMAEAGLAYLVVSGWFGVYAPPGTPTDRIQRVSRALLGVFADRSVLNALKPHGAEPAPADAARFCAWTRQEAARWGELIRRGGIRAG